MQQELTKMQQQNQQNKDFEVAKLTIHPNKGWYRAPIPMINTADRDSLVPLMSDGLLQW